ncbi:hypothetical protein [Rhodococcus triatomae]|nr:hypothetical protein G419_05502 [Rhodococcus triatomae BKS 15-14]
MQVDPEQLRVLAAGMYESGETIDDIDVRTMIDGAGDFLPGCGVVSAVREAGEFTEGAYLRMAERARLIAFVAKGGANDFEVSEDEFRADLGAIGAAG